MTRRRHTAETLRIAIAALPEVPEWCEVNMLEDDIVTDVLWSIANGAPDAADMAAQLMRLRDPHFDERRDA